MLFAWYHAYIYILSHIRAICILTCVHIYIYIYTCIHVYMYIYTYTHTHFSTFVPVATIILSQDEDMEPLTVFEAEPATAPATSSAPAAWRKTGEVLRISVGLPWKMEDLIGILWETNVPIGLRTSLENVFIGDYIPNTRKWCSIRTFIVFGFPWKMTDFTKIVPEIL